MLQGLLMLLALIGGYFVQYPLYGAEKMSERDGKTLYLSSFVLGLGMMFWVMALLFAYDDFTKNKPIPSYEVILIFSPIVIYLILVFICISIRKKRENINKRYGISYAGRILSGKVFSGEFLLLVQNYYPQNVTISKLGIDDQNKLCKYLGSVGTIWYGKADISKKKFKIIESFEMLDIFVIISENKEKEQNELIKDIRNKLNDLSLTDDVLIKVINHVKNAY